MVKNVGVYEYSRKKELLTCVGFTEFALSRKFFKNNKITEDGKKIIYRYCFENIKII